MIDSTEVSMVGRLSSIAFVIVCVLGIARGAHAQGTVPDGKYGYGGTKTTTVQTHADGSKTWTTTWKDPKGTIRKQETDTLEKDGYLTEKDEWFNEQGKKYYQEVGKYDDYDYCYYWQEESYTDGVLESGDIWEWDDGWMHKYWDKAKQRYDERLQLRFDILKSIAGFGKEAVAQDTFYVGAAIVLEDGGQSFGTYGVNASYTHSLDKRINLMGDVQWTKGSDDFQAYTKFQVLGGLSLCQHIHDSWSLQPHILGGVAIVTPESNGTSYDSTTAFALAIGLDIGMRFSRQLEWIGRVDYNPTFSDGVQNNFRFSSGLRFTF